MTEFDKELVRRYELILESKSTKLHTTEIFKTI